MSTAADLVDNDPPPTDAEVAAAWKVLDRHFAALRAERERSQPRPPPPAAPSRSRLRAPMFDRPEWVRGAS